MPRTTKTAVSLPFKIFDHAEKLRRHLKLSRSSLYARALSAYLKSEYMRALEAACVAGYLRMPETKAETADVEAFAKLAGEALAAEDPEGWKD